MAEEKEKRENRFVNFSKINQAVTGIKNGYDFFDKYRIFPSQLQKKYTREQIHEIIFNGSIEQKRSLSNNIFNQSGLYKRFILHLSTMLTYDTLLVPKLFNPTKKISESEVMEKFYESMWFTDDLRVEEEFARIMTLMLVNGAYFGILREYEDGTFIIQDLPHEYCRSNYKTINGIHLLEFNVKYFDTIKDDKQRKLILNTYPKEVRNKYRQKSREGFSSIGVLLEDADYWVTVDPQYGMVFYYGDQSPILLATIEAIEDLNEYKGLEKALDKQELKKLLIQQMPIDKEGELIFTLEEGESLHRGIVEMLRNNEDMDVLTTFADTKVVDFQDSTSANRDNLEKVERSVYNEAGISRQLFASDSSTALNMSLNNDFALVFDISKMFSTWMTHQVNVRFSKKKKYFFEVSILPISHYNRGEIFKLYLQGAQYGYSKILAGIAAGTKQSDLLNLITLENDYLDLPTRMLPLQSSHTASGAPEKQTGAPKKADEQKADQTIANENSK